MAGHRVRYTTAAALVNKLVEAADDKQLGRTIARYGRVDLLEIDELGYLELDRYGAEMLFQVLTEREKTNSIAIASNEAFTGWSKTFTDPRLCAAREPTKRSHLDSEVKPSIACATASVTSSESVNCGGLPSHRVPPISSSIFTYSAVSRASRSLITD